MAGKVVPEAVFEGEPVVYAESVEAWRTWLETNGATSGPIRLVIFHKGSVVPSVGYAEAIEHCLCYGWIDSKAVKRDPESFYLRFSPRKPSSTWSKVNRERAQRMIEAGLMRPAGQAMIDLAKETGRWEVVPDEATEAIPDDLGAAFARSPEALANFDAFPPSSRRLILEWIAKARRPETRQRRIEQTVTLAAQNIRANHPTTRR